MKVKHSPLPWVTEQPDGRFHTTNIVDSHGHLVANVQSVPYRTTGRADADYIVRACVCFPILLAALKQLCSGLNEADVTHPRIEGWEIKRARDAIARAEFKPRRDSYDDRMARYKRWLKKVAP